MRGSIFDGLTTAPQFAVCNFYFGQRAQGLRYLKISFENPDALKSVERYTILSAIDRLWQEHLYEMDVSLRYSIGLRAHGQKGPAHRIQGGKEAFQIFDELMVNIKSDICRHIFLKRIEHARLRRFFLRNAHARNPP